MKLGTAIGAVLLIMGCSTLALAVTEPKVVSMVVYGKKLGSPGSDQGAAEGRADHDEGYEHDEHEEHR